MEDETINEVASITEMPPQQPDERQWLQTPQTQKIAVGQVFMSNYAKAGKKMLKAAIAQCGLVVLMYSVGYVFASFYEPLSDLMYNELDIDIEKFTLAYTGLIILWTSILLVPSVVFMFCFAVSAKKAANGNSTALLRSTRNLKNFFLVSGIVIMVAVFLAMILVVTGINSSDTTIVFNY